MNVPHQTDRSTSSPYAVPLDELEAQVHVAANAMTESQPDPVVPHDLLFEDMALGRAPAPR